MNARIIRGPKSTFEKEMRGLDECFFDMAGEHEGKICQVDSVTGHGESFSSVKTRSLRAAIHMRELDINSEDIILFCSGNNLNNMIPVLASLYLGAKVSSLDPSLAVRDCAHGISIVKPRFVFAEEESVELMEMSLLEADHEAEIIVIGNSSKYKTFFDLQLPSEEENCFRPVSVNCQDTAIIFFSSGTTGLPKGICVTHYGLLNGMKGVLSMDVMKTDVQMHFTSLYWISAAMFMITSFLTGGCRILAPKFDAVKTFEWIEKYKVNHMGIPPTYSYNLTGVENHERYDTSSLYSLGLGGTAVSPALVLKTRRVFKHSFVAVGYGSTEAAGYITTYDLTKDRHLMDKLGSTGKCVVDMDIKIVDIETRKLRGPHQIGELLLRSPYQMKGYYNMDSSTCFDEEGFIKTGDIAYYDEDDCIYIVDRIKEAFKYKSWHVVPASIEAVLQDHSAVVEAVVFGIPHEIDGFHPAACVVLKSGGSVEDVQKFVDERVSEWHKLRGGIKVVNLIKKTPSGKIQRTKMRDMFMEM